MKSIISSHNKAVLSDYHQSQTETSNKECNYRKNDQCPLDGKCLKQNVIYQATVTTQKSSESYVGLATNFKDRYRNHTASFWHESKRNETELSKHFFGHSKTPTNLSERSSERSNSLRLVYDKIIVHIHGLSVLGVASDQYNGLLIPVIMLPNEVQVRIAWQTKGTVWKIEELMDVIKWEVEAREVSESVKITEERNQTPPLCQHKNGSSTHPHIL